MKTLRVWTKPQIQVTAVKLAEAHTSRGSDSALLHSS